MWVRHLGATRSFSVNGRIQCWTIQPGPRALGNGVQQSRSTVRPAVTLFSWHIKEYITRKYTLKSNCLCIYLLSSRLAAIVIHGSHLSDNALIHSSNKHIAPGYLRVGVAAVPLAKQEAANSRWCWLINWQVNFQMDNESRTLKRWQGEVSGPLLYMDAVPSIYYWQKHSQGAGTRAPAKRLCYQRNHGFLFKSPLLLFGFKNTQSTWSQDISSPPRFTETWQKKKKIL